MPGSPAELRHDWPDFYGLVGTALATLVGLMFVAASIGPNVFNEEHRGPMKVFIMPTVVHFAAALFVCLLVTIAARIGGRPLDCSPASATPGT